MYCLLNIVTFQIIEDITGNSHVENPKAPSADPLLHTMRFFRTKAQNDLLGIETPNSQVGDTDL